MLSNELLDEALKTLAVEKNQEFGIEGRRYFYRINNTGLQYYKPNSSGWKDSALLKELLLGQVKITFK